jgi:pimeloyl-ACP methyl ester carboxylesterase
VTRPRFLESNKKSLDFFSIDFNEDFSAFHGPTVHEQARFIVDSLRYIRSLYPPESFTKTTVIAHSMGGISARLALLDAESDVVDTLVTLSTPHLIPPAPFDPILESIYSQINTPPLLPPPQDFTIVSISGGEKDSMVSSDSCSLPDHLAPFGFSTYTTSLPGLWSEVDHVAMMWCDQLRTAIVRGLIEGQGEAAQARSRALRDTLLAGFQDESDAFQVLSEGSDSLDGSEIDANPWPGPTDPDVWLTPVEKDKTFVFLGRGGDVKIWLCETAHVCSSADVEKRSAVLPGSRDGADVFKYFQLGPGEVQGKEYVGTTRREMLAAGFQEMDSPNFKLGLAGERLGSKS